MIKLKMTEFIISINKFTTTIDFQPAPDFTDLPHKKDRGHSALL